MAKRCSSLATDKRRFDIPMGLFKSRLQMVLSKGSTLMALKTSISQTALKSLLMPTESEPYFYPVDKRKYIPQLTRNANTQMVLQRFCTTMAGWKPAYPTDAFE